MVELTLREYLLVTIIVLSFAAYFILNPPLSKETVQNISATALGVFQDPGNSFTPPLCADFLFGDEGFSLYEYSVASTGSPKVLGHLKSFVDVGTVNGSLVHIRTLNYSSITTINGRNFATTSISRVYLDPRTLTCISQRTETTTNNVVSEDESPCPTLVPWATYSTFMRCTSNFRYLRTEQITVQAGSFDAKVYEDINSGTTYWGGGLPFPVRVRSAKMIMELTDYHYLPFFPSTVPRLG